MELKHKQRKCFAFLGIIMLKFSRLRSFILLVRVIWKMKMSVEQWWNNNDWGEEHHFVRRSPGLARSSF
jgi:hypothetical protein